MPRNVVHLTDGDLAAIVVDTDSGRIEIYDELQSDPETPLEEETGDTVLIQGHLSDETRDALIVALGGDPPNT